MTEAPQEQRIDAEWVALTAFRDILKLSTKGSISKSTYAEALDFGAELYPALLGHETSVLRRAVESDATKEYRQRARLKSQVSGTTISAADLLNIEILEIEQLLNAAKATREKGRVDQLKSRLKTLKNARQELDPPPHSETQLIARDAAAFPAGLPALESGRGYRAFELPDGNALRVHLFHPDKPEHVSGADVLYERHSASSEMVSLVFVQDKIWERQTLSMTDPRLKAQLTKLKSLVCDGGLCHVNEIKGPYRFPYCAAFLRPTDKLQTPNQKMLSSGEHLPICRIDECTQESRSGTPLISFRSIRGTSISGSTFEYMFSYDKLGSRQLTHDELKQLYDHLRIATDPGQLVLHAQEFDLLGIEA